MSQTNLDKKQQLIRNALLQRGWVSAEQMAAAEAFVGGQPGARLEVYLSENNIISAKQSEHVALFYDMAERVADFEIDDIVGAGAMGVVYLGHSEDGRTVAIKVINKKHCDDEEFIKRFERETNVVSELQHDSIVAALSAGSIGEDMYLATEFVDGPSLAEMLDDFGPLPEAYVLKCILQVADGLEHAYKNGGLVHRDMKPPNILIDHGENSSKFDLEPRDNDVAKVIDFGLAKKTNDTDNLTLTGLTVGTPHYMAPEQIRADPDIDCRADIYSLGTTLYHLLTGQTPFSGNSPGAIMLAHVNDEIPNPSEVIPSLHSETVELVMLAMAKKRDERFANYAAFKQALNGALKAAGGAETGMRVLRKPLVVKNKLKKKKSEPRMAAVEDAADKASADPNAVTQRTERIEQSNTTRKMPIKVNEEEPRKGSSSMLRMVQQRMFSHKTSAAFDDDVDQRMGVSLWVWLALAASLIFMLITLMMRYL